MPGHAHIRFEGEASACSPWLPLARRYLAQLREIGLDFNTRRYRISADVEIKVELAGGTSYIVIKAGGSCPPYLSGIVSPGAHLRRQEVDPNGQPTGRAENVLYRFFPSAKTAVGGVQEWRFPGFGYQPIDPILQYRPPMLPFSIEDGGWQFVEASQQFNLRPGLYSGKMRAVMQYLLGGAGQAHYDFRFTRTHGIYVQSRVNDAGKVVTRDWLIEISQANGVLAMPLPICTDKVAADNPLDYVPLGLPFPQKIDEAVAAGRVRRLAPAEELSDFYSNTAFFPECGWAFSASGHAAQNTCWSWPDKYKRAHRYRIDFSADNAGAPISASIVLAETGYMIGSLAIAGAAGQVQFPFYPLLGTVTFDMRPEGFYDLPVDSLCPIYVFYSGESEQVIRWKNEATGIVHIAETLEPTSTELMKFAANYGTEFFFTATQGGITIGDKFGHAIDSPALPAIRDRTASGGYGTLVLDKGSPSYLRLWLDGSNPTICDLITPAWVDRTVWSSGYVLQVVESCVIPLFDRESYFHYRHKQETGFRVSRTVQNWDIMQNIDGQAWYQPTFDEFHAITGFKQTGRMVQFSGPGEYRLGGNPTQQGFRGNGFIITPAFRELTAAEVYGNQNFSEFDRAYSSSNDQIDLREAQVIFDGSTSGPISMPVPVAYVDSSVNPWTAISPDAFGNMIVLAALRSHEAQLYVVSEGVNDIRLDSGFGASLAGYQLTDNPHPLTLCFVGTAYDVPKSA